MYCVSRKGKDRQVLHERIRVHSIAASQAIKNEGKENDLLERILGDEAFDLSREELDEIMDVNAFTGRAKEQVAEYIDEVVDPILKANEGRIGTTANVTV